ncbi:hypothetical protein NDU88_001962 [Pleurodeles waltl]|uniref:Uncharacterized protein n=1 Tax=Pleurodeles waltl TaxID=8319 RepID=A0AAV7KSW0_PLEWA|nr:hypothetical protein NDU88_001962 [Pleurodeles waltl]
MLPRAIAPVNDQAAVPRSTRRAMLVGAPPCPLQARGCSAASAGRRVTNRALKGCSRGSPARENVSGSTRTQ